MIGVPLLGCINTVSEEWSQWGAATGRLIGVGSGQGNPPNRWTHLTEHSQVLGHMCDYHTCNVY